MADDHTSIAQRIREQLDTYLVALSFTLLGLAVETADFGALVWADILEVTGWLALFLSGLTALSRLEWTSHVHKVHGMKDSNEELLLGLQKGMAQRGEFVSARTGASISPEREVTVAEKNIATIDEALTSLNRQLTARYWMQRVSFIAGLAALLVARGLAGLSAWW